MQIQQKWIKMGQKKTTTDNKTPYSGDANLPNNLIFKPEQWLAVIWTIILFVSVVGAFIKC